MSCPECGGELENYTETEGGWCPDCEEWWPADVVREAEDDPDIDIEDNPYWGDDLDGSFYELPIKSKGERTP